MYHNIRITERFQTKFSRKIATCAYLTKANTIRCHVHIYAKQHVFDRTALIKYGTSWAAICRSQ